MEECFPVFAKYPKLYDNYLAIKNGNQQRHWKTEVVVYWGPPGTGKTRRAQFEAGKDAYWLRKPISRNGALWWDGYEGQDVVVIDEFYGWIARDFMQRMRPLSADGGDQGQCRALSIEEGNHYFESRSEGLVEDRSWSYGASYRVYGVYGRCGESVDAAAAAGYAVGPGVGTTV